MDYRPVTLPSIASLLNPQNGSPPGNLVDNFLISNRDIPELDLGPPAVEFIGSETILNRFPSHSKDLEFLVQQTPIPLQVSRFAVPTHRPATIKSYFVKYGTAGFKGVVTDGPSPYWKYPASGPYYPPPGPFQSNLSLILEDALVIPYSPPCSKFLEEESYVSGKLREKRKRTVTPDIFMSSWKRQQTTNESKYRATHACPGLTDSYNFSDPLDADTGEASQQKSSFVGAQYKGTFQDLIDRSALSKDKRAGKITNYVGISPEDHRMFGLQKSQHPGCDIDGSFDPLTAGLPYAGLASLASFPAIGNWKESMPLPTPKAHNVLLSPFEYSSDVVDSSRIPLSDEL